jgi:diguanylate cyclase (GGDEF)-like protein
MADIDHFKDVNDTFTHDTGDSVLRVLGQLFSAEARLGQLAVRYGGEEFLFVMLDVDLSTAARFAERLRARAAARAWPELPDHRQLTVSFGVARGILTSWRSVVVAADEALFRAKLARNRVEVASSPSEQEYGTSSFCTPVEG